MEELDGVTELAVEMVEGLMADGKPPTAPQEPDEVAELVCEMELTAIDGVLLASDARFCPEARLPSCFCPMNNPRRENGAAVPA